MVKRAYTWTPPTVSNCFQLFHGDFFVFCSIFLFCLSLCQKVAFVGICCMNDSFGGLCSTICKICSVPTVSDCFRLFPTVSDCFRLFPYQYCWVQPVMGISYLFYRLSSMCHKKKNKPHLQMVLISCVTSSACAVSHPVAPGRHWFRPNLM